MPDTPFTLNGVDLVEAAARAAFEGAPLARWDSAHESSREIYRRDIRLALTAAHVPELLAVVETALAFLAAGDLDRTDLIDALIVACIPFQSRSEDGDQGTTPNAQQVEEPRDYYDVWPQ